MIDILPCPFCGHDDVEICEVEPGRIAIDCPECQCIGPFADALEDAAALWNAPTRERRILAAHDAIVTAQVLAHERKIEKLLADKYALMGNAKSEGADAALSRTLPLD